jgi:hypothetical protein
MRWHRPCPASSDEATDHGFRSGSQSQLCGLLNLLPCGSLPIVTLRFESDMSHVMQDEASTPLQDDNPNTAPTREQRSGRLFASTMRIPGLGERPVTIRNLSPSGAGLRADKPPPIGTMIILALGHYGNVNARVRWVEGRLFGVTLAEEIDPESFNFAAKSWDDVSGGHAAHCVADRFRPETNTYRPGFRLR